MWIINTRPKERAEQLTKALQGQGHQVFELPLLDLAPLPLEQTLEQQFVQFLDAEVVVVVSSIAVQLGMQYYQALNLPLEKLQAKQWIAVGRSTQAELLRYGITSECPELETSEGMLQLPILEKMNFQHIAFWRGIGGRTLMMEHLQSQGIKVLNMLLYRRAMPAYTQQTREQIKLRLPAAVLISSEASWENWLSFCTDDAVLSEAIPQNVYVVLGERVGTIVKTYFEKRYQMTSVKMIDQVRADHIHQQLQQCWSS